MKLLSTGLAHLGLRVTDLARARQFYVDILGFQPLAEQSGLLICNAYGSVIAFRGDEPQTDKQDRFNPYRVGLDHVALAVPDLNALETMKSGLDGASVPNHGIEQDEFTHASYISFYDPDGIAWELYVTPKR